MEDTFEQGVKEAILENQPSVEPPATEQEPVTEPISEEQPAAEGESGVDVQEIAAPVEPEIQPNIPYERFREVNEAKIRAEEQARIYQEQLQKYNAPVESEPEPEPEEDYTVTDEEWEYMDDASRKVYLQNQKLAAELREIKDAVKGIQPIVQQTEAQRQAEAKAQAELKSTIADIALIGDLSPDAQAALSAKTIEVATEAMNAGKPFGTVKEAVIAAYKATKTPAVPPKPVVNPVVAAAKQAVQKPGGVSVPTGARPVVEGTMSMDDAIRAAMNEIPKPR